jgi:hypothetical protein
MRGILNAIKINIEIQAPIEKVWHTMLDDKTYREWTKEFNPNGSWYVGELKAGEKINFIGPDAQGKLGGIVSSVKELRMYEYISFEHVGYIADGVADTESEGVKAWAPSYENYTFVKVSESTTQLSIECEIEPTYMDMMGALWPKALAKLKGMCER